MRFTASLKVLCVSAVVAVMLAGCGSDGDINISADDNSTVNNPPDSGGGGNNPCAAYVDPDTGLTVQGSFDGTNCIRVGLPTWKNVGPVHR